MKIVFRVQVFCNYQSLYVRLAAPGRAKLRSIGQKPSNHHIWGVRAPTPACLARPTIRFSFLVSRRILAGKMLPSSQSMCWKHLAPTRKLFQSYAPMLPCSHAPMLPSSRRMSHAKSASSWPGTAQSLLAAGASGSKVQPRGFSIRPVPAGARVLAVGWRFRMQYLI